MSPDGKTVRLIAALAAVVLIVGLAVAASLMRATPEVAEAPEDAAASAEQPTPSPEVSEAAAEAALTSPEHAEAIGAEALLAAARDAADLEWAEIGHPAWAVRERPVYVASAVLEDRRGVDVDTVIAFRADEPVDELVLRLLPAARVLSGGDLRVTVRRDGTSAPHQVDREGARLLVTLDPPLEAGEAAIVRVGLRYALLGHEEIAEVGGPAGHGLLAWTESASVLGHWLPLLTFDDGPMADLGDVSGFPAAVWSVLVEGAPEIVASGHQSACPDEGRECTWIRGIALREVALVAYDELIEVESSVDEMTLRTVLPSAEGDAAEAAHEVLESTFASLRDALGPLPWRRLDLAGVDLRGDAAGMEFPGLILVDLGMWDSIPGGFGEFVIAHEVAHQWFEALVGSGSLTAPVVDESLAQYLAFVYWAEEHGEDAARQLAETLFRSPYVRALREGMRDGPPAQAAHRFSGPDQFFVLVYCRGALAWIVAEQAVGREAVLSYLRGVVARHGLRHLDAEALLADAVEHGGPIGQVIERWWFNPETPDEVRPSPSARQPGIPWAHAVVPRRL